MAAMATMTGNQTLRSKGLKKAARFDFSLK
jgi:hypothetical protein